MSSLAWQWLPQAFQDNGQPSLLLWLVVLSALVLALLFGGRAAQLFAKSVKRTESSKREDETQANGAERYPISARVIAMSSLDTIKSIGKIALVLVLGFGAGWIWRDYQFFANRFRFEDVLILARYDATHFRVQPARMRAYDWTTCAAADWQVNEKMEFVQYQQRTGCKDVTERGAYKFHELNGKRLKYQQEVANVGY